ncbi:Putative NTF2-like domain superfamily, SnoaL-like domain-containing protein [Septoria linicola]|uniref:NTF2-like domain superfamily, SnoaL-like domain-containing protein n=1 Tax=Septoria linicola TaxID=215465 RepID=A0A9Q9B009_9PEZI|nr:Putative NTF2-like domain superfamily, SnoaL-like domain-containing protein [Septoria linicola]
MHFLTTISLGALALLQPIAATYTIPFNGPYCPSQPVSSTQQRAIFNQFIQKFYIEKNATAAFSEHVAESYIQHNPNVLSGRENAIAAFESFDLSGVNFTLLNVGLDGDRGWVHYRSEGAGMEPSAIVDVFRFNESCIEQHWDVFQTKPANATNPLALW